MSAEQIVSFQNAGVMDLRAVTTMGASVKEGDNPIGYFGTGLKYAIAVVMRHGGTVNIYLGQERYEFSTKRVLIRGKEFDVVRMNNKEMGFTTELGKTWQMWMAFREIYCNTLDEKGTMEFGVVRPKPGHTTVVVDCPEFALAARSKAEYHLESKPYIATPSVEFHHTSSCNVFYRRVRVHETQKPWKYTVNLLAPQELTEDRTLKNTWYVDDQVGTAIAGIKDPEFLRGWLMVGENYKEHSVGLPRWELEDNPVLMEVARAAFNDPHDFPKLNTSVKAYLKTEHGEPAFQETPELLPVEQAGLDEAIQMCRQMGYHVDEYPIMVCESLGENILGEAHVKTKKILLARAAIAQGKLSLAGTLIEEWCHIKHRHSDCSRGMQNWLLENLVKMGASYLMVKPK